MPKLKVTPSIYREAMADKPEIIRYYRNYEKRDHKIAVYLRCCTRNGILKVACFTTEEIRTGSKKPLYGSISAKKKKRILPIRSRRKNGSLHPFGVCHGPYTFTETK